MSEQVSTQGTAEKFEPSSIFGQKSNDFANIMNMAQLVMRPDMAKQLEQFQVGGEDEDQTACRVEQDTRFIT